MKDKKPIKKRLLVEITATLEIDVSCNWDLSSINDVLEKCQEYGDAQVTDIEILTGDKKVGV